MSYHDHRSSPGEPREPDDRNPRHRLFYVYLLGAAAFVMMIWTAVAFERNQPKPAAPKPLPPVVVKMPERVTHPARPAPDPAPTLSTVAGESLDLRPSVDTRAEAAPEPSQEAIHAKGIPAEQPAVEHVPTVHRAGRNHHRRHHHHGQRRLHHHWAGHRHGKPSQTYCEAPCEFFKGTARAAGLIP